MQELLTPTDVLMDLARECARTSHRATARRLGVSAQFMCDVLRRRREITDLLAARLGYRRVTRFAPTPLMKAKSRLR